MSEIVFAADKLAFTFRGRAPKSFNFGQLTLNAGETVAVRGGSGAGKTTLLRLIEGSLSSGESEIKVRKKAAMIFQDLRLVLEATVLTNVLSGALAELPSYSLSFEASHIAKAKELLSEVGLSEFLEVRVSELSGGQKQRVAIARALMAMPRILVADESFAHLDSETASEVFNLIKSLQSKYQFVFLVSQHEAHIPYDKFDRQIFVKNVSESKRPSQVSKIGVVLIVGIWLFALIASFLSLNLKGFNSQSAWSELARTFFRFLPLSASDWQFEVVVKYLKSIFSTLQMALIASSLGFLISFPLSILSSTSFNFAIASRLIRTMLMFIRVIPSLIWALLFVAAVGIGPVSGIMALTLYSVGYLSKLIYESLESIELKSFQSLRGLGASKWQSFWVAVFPSAKGIGLSHFLYSFEYNIRAASILGLVGAGGIGQELMSAIEWRRFESAGVILLLLLVVIAIVDRGSEQIRKYFLSHSGQ